MSVRLDHHFNINVCKGLRAELYDSYILKRPIVFFQFQSVVGVQLNPRVVVVPGVD